MRAGATSRAGAVLAAVLAGSLLLAACASAADLEGFDEEETIAPAAPAAPPPTEQAAPAPPPAFDPVAAGAEKLDDEPRVPFLSASTLDAFVQKFDAFSKALLYERHFELFMVVFLTCYGINYILGARANEGVTLAWANMYGLGHEDTLYGRNFARVGLDTERQTNEILFRDGQATFKCWASGRRYCQGMLTTLQLKNRHDILSLAWDVLSPAEDRIKVEVQMSEPCMAPMVLAVVSRRRTKAFVAAEKDVKRLAKLIEPTRDNWPASLVILAESNELARDLITEPAVKNVFDAKAFARHGRYFESMHFTTEQKVGGAKASLLKFSFKLPAEADMADLQPLMELVFHSIDAVGSYKLAGEALKKAQQRRQELAEKEFKSSLEARQEAAQRKREERFQREKKEASAGQAAKMEEKRKAKLQKKLQPKMKMKKI